MNAKQKEFHHAMAAHHTAMSDECHKAAEHEGTPPALATTFKAMAIHHESAAEHNLNCCKADGGDLEKTDGALVAELRALVKALGGAVAPLPGGLSLIPRFGARDPKAEKDVVKAVDPTLRHLVADESESQPSAVAFNEQRQ